MLKRSFGLYPPHLLWNALPIVQLASVPIREMWRLGRDTIMNPPVQIMTGGRSGMVWDLGGWSACKHGQLANMFLAILQVCWHCHAGREESCFEYSERLVRHVCEGLHSHIVGL